MQTDGQLKTGRDVVIAALLGAEEFGFATAPLVVSGCVMMRVCHLDTCPVGIATQNPVLRDRFSGKPEFVVNFFEFIAEEVREILAELGFRTHRGGRRPRRTPRHRPGRDHWKAQGLDLAPLFHVPELPEGAVRHAVIEQDHGLAKALDNELIKLAADALEAESAEAAQPVRAQIAIRNINRTVGTMLGHEVTKKFGGAGLPDDTIDITFTGSAGQSFGAFLPSGVTLRLEGDANDYVGKGLSGGRVIVRPDRGADHLAEYSTIAGNTIALRRDRRRAVPARPHRRALLRPQLRRHRRLGGRGRPRLRVHDRRPRRRPRRDRAQLRGRHVRRHRLRHRPRPRTTSTPGTWTPSRPSSDTDKQWLHDVVRRHFEETGSTVAEKLLADWVTRTWTASARSSRPRTRQCSPPRTPLSSPVSPSRRPPRR